jgi:hypothetical protein
VEWSGAAGVDTGSTVTRDVVAQFCQHLTERGVAARRRARARCRWLRRLFLSRW